MPNPGELAIQRHERCYTLAALQATRRKPSSGAAEHGRLMVTLSLVEDLAVVMLAVVLPSFSPESDATLGQAAWKVGQAILLLVPIAAAAWKLFPPLLAKVEKACNDEVSRLLALTLCVGIAALTEAVGCDRFPLPEAGRETFRPCDSGNGSNSLDALRFFALRTLPV